MVTLVAIIVWRFPLYLVLPVFIVFGLWDGLFLSSALVKVPDGAWFTLAVAVVLCSFFVLWRFGKEEQWKSESTDSLPLSKALLLDFTADQKADLQLQPTLGGSPVLPLKGLGLFFDKAGNASAAPIVFVHFLKKFSASPVVTVFFHLRPLESPSVPADEQFTITRCYATGPDGAKVAIPNCYRMIVRHGYMDEVVSPDLGLLVVNQVRKYLLAEEGVKYLTAHDKEAEGPPSPTPELALLQKAYNDQVLYVVGKEQLRLTPGTNLVRRLFLGLYLWVRENTRSKVQHLNVEVERLVEVGFVKDI
jgi:KUP system potassium uptake protein